MKTTNHTCGATMRGGIRQPSGGVRRASERTGLRAFTLAEMLVVITIIGVIASLVLTVGRSVSGKRDKAVVDTARHEIETAIEAFHAKFGSYPRDNTNNPAFSSLFYELTGALYDKTTFTFRPLSYPGMDLDTIVLDTFFSVDGLENASDNRSDVKNFFPAIKASQYMFLTNAVLTQQRGSNVSVYVLKVPVKPHPAFRTNYTWHYDRSSTNRHNPEGSYDFWAEWYSGNTTPAGSLKTNFSKNW